MEQAKPVEEHYFRLSIWVSVCPNCRAVDWRITEVSGSYRFWCLQCDWVFTEGFEGKREMPRAE